ncbi:hypothetical protein BsWGS_05228 [Bradybaena similaris]
MIAFPRSSSRELEAGCDTQSGRAIEVAAGIHGILAGATEFMHCAKFFHMEEITMWFLAWERGQEHLWSNDSTYGLVSSVKSFILNHNPSLMITSFSEIKRLS